MESVRIKAEEDAVEIINDLFRNYTFEKEKKRDMR